MLEKLGNALVKAVKTDESHQWLMANEITHKIIFKPAQLMGWNGTEPLQGMLLSSIESPLLDALRAVDILWTKHTCGHFGFSSQKSVYENCKTFEEFSLCINWTLPSDKCSTTSFSFGYPLEIRYIRTEYSFLGEVEQSYPMCVSRKAALQYLVC